MLWLIPSILLILAFLSLYAFIWKRVNHHWVKHNGEPVVAEITEVVPKKRGDYGLTYELRAQWQRPEDGKIFAYRIGEWLRKDPTAFLEAQGATHVTVRIDPKAPSTHWVELDFLPDDYFVQRGKFTI